MDIDESEDENVNGFDGVSSDDEAHDEPRVRNISIRTGVLDEKAAATQALGLFALHTKSSFAPYPLCVWFFILFLFQPGKWLIEFLDHHKLFGGVIEDFG